MGTEDTTRSAYFSLLAIYFYNYSHIERCHKASIQSICTLIISNLKSQISNIKYHISNTKYQILNPNPKSKSLIQIPNPNPKSKSQIPIPNPNLKSKSQIQIPN